MRCDGGSPDLVFLFPGQSSVSPYAVARARCAHPSADAIAERARAILEPDDAAAWLDQPRARLASNRDVQVIVFLATQMYLHALANEGIDAAWSMGLSLGEYSHLVHIGALDFEQALALVSERGHCFDQAPAGRMITVLAVDGEAVADVVAQASRRGTIVISNYNAPTQHVIAGEAGAVTWAATVLEEEFAAHTAVIEERVPMHSPLMIGPARSFSSALAEGSWKTPRLPYMPNVTASPVDAPAAADFVSTLTRHVHEPVQWRESMDVTAALRPHAVFIEVGPGRVLHNMTARSWRALKRAHVDDPEGEPGTVFAAALEQIRQRPC